MTSSVSYSLKIKQSAVKALAKIDKPNRLRLIQAIDALSGAPHKGESMKGEMTGLRRIRVGDYRVIYEVAERELLILVIRIGHRRDVYRSRN